MSSFFPALDRPIPPHRQWLDLCVKKWGEALSRCRHPVDSTPCSHPLLRTRVLSSQILLCFRGLPYLWGLVLSNYLKACPEYVKKSLATFFKALGPTCSVCLRQVLKDVHLLALHRCIHNNEVIPLYFLDLKVLEGYGIRSDAPLEAFEDFVHPRSAPPMSEDVARAIREVVSEIGIKPVRYSFTDYISFRDAWGTMGTTFQGVPAKVSFGRKRPLYRTLRDKWSATLALSDLEIREACNNVHPLVRSFRKADEPGSERLIFSYDLWSTIRSSYLYEGVVLSTQNPFTTVDMPPAGMARLRKKFFCQAGHGRAFFSLDQSGFDRHQSVEAQKLALSLLFERISSLGHSDLRTVAKLELESLNNVTITHPDNRHQRFSWKKGLLSGHRLTALLGTILNAAYARCVFRRLGYQIVDSIYQGDDALVLVQGSPAMEEVVEQYAALGMEVNRGKSLLHPERFEYLHLLHTGGSVYGMPARIFKSLVWRKTIRSEWGVSSVNSYLDTLRKGFRRGLRPIPLLRRFLSNYVKQRNLFDEYLITSTVDGGFGLGSTGRVALKSKTEMPNCPMQIHTPVLLDVPQACKAHALYQRYSALRPLRGAKSALWLERIAVSSPNCDPISLPKLSRLPRVDWAVSDLPSEPKAYSRKLMLQWKLSSGVVIRGDDLPPGSLLSSSHDPDACTRWVVKMRELPFSIEGPYSSAEPLAYLLRLAREVWNFGVTHRHPVEEDFILALKTVFREVLNLPPMYSKGRKPLRYGEWLGPSVYA